MIIRMYLSTLLLTILPLFIEAQSLQKANQQSIIRAKETFKVSLSNHQVEVLGSVKAEKVYSYDFLLKAVDSSNSDKYQLKMQLTNFSFDSKMWISERLQFSSVYNTNPQSKTSHEFFDQTIKHLLQKEFTILIDKRNDSITVDGADNYINEFDPVFASAKEGIQIMYSNDYFEGLFNTFIGITKKTTLEKGDTWSFLRRKESLIKTVYADNTYKFDSAIKNKIFLTVQGTLSYRKPSWSSLYKSKNAYTGTVYGNIILNKESYIPSRLRLFYEFITPADQYVPHEGKLQCDVQVNFEKLID